MNENFPPPPPPSELASFPRRTLRKGRRVFRLHHRDLSPFWFAATPETDDGGNRFDLVPPNGASYWALQPAVAMLETLARRPIRMIPTELIERFALTESPLPHDLTNIANLPVKAARRFGLTAEIHTSANRRLTRAWAQALFSAACTAVVSLPRHDVTGRHRSLTMWGPSGEQPPYGWKWSADTGPVPAEAIEELALWGIRVVPVPFEVATITPVPLN